jgi:hypothetical protein
MFSFLFREMLGQHPENVRMLVKTCILNEFSQSRNPNNLMLVSIAFSHSPEISSKVITYVHDNDIDHFCSVLMIASKLFFDRTLKLYKHMKKSGVR